MIDLPCYIAVLDLGTTNLRVSLFTVEGALKDRLYSRLPVISREKGQFEIDPDKIFLDCTNLLKELFAKNDISKTNGVCLGISTHRNSFLLWNRL